MTLASQSVLLRPSWPLGAGSYYRSKDKNRMDVSLVYLFFRVFQKMLYTTPSPQRKKEPSTGPNKLRLFLKRSSEPLLNLQNPTEKPATHTHQTLIAEEFEPDVFRQLIEYIHTGCVTLQPRTLLGISETIRYTLII